MPQRTRIKICGITNLEDALYAANIGADALGFIFYTQSPRYIAPSAAREIINALPPFVTTIAVTVNLNVEELLKTMTISRCQVIQYHGDIADNQLTELAFPIIKAIPIAIREDLESLARYPSARAFLLDTKKTGLYGGTGVTFDWHLAHEARNCGRPIILSGGLSPTNISEALCCAEPYAIDINSGIESAPGHKDHQQMQELFHIAREFDSSKQ
jgi:phosphoribosylanthranilate isomerase